MKRVIIVHGWGGHPDEAWIPWLKEALHEHGFEVMTPIMPDTEHPRIKEWVDELSRVIGEPDKETHLVGHSIGCQAILRYLSGLDRSGVGEVVFVAPWVTLHGEYDDEELSIAQPWLETPIDYGKAQERAEHFTAIFSDDDPDVPLANKDIFHEKLGAEVIVEHGKGHFSEDSGVKELPAARDALLA